MFARVNIVEYKNPIWEQDEIFYLTGPHIINTHYIKVISSFLRGFFLQPYSKHTIMLDKVPNGIKTILIFCMRLYRFLYLLHLLSTQTLFSQSSMCCTKRQNSDCDECFFVYFQPSLVPGLHNFITKSYGGRSINVRI